jgi:hypothetical protein
MSSVFRTTRTMSIADELTEVSPQDKMIIMTVERLDRLEQETNVLTELKVKQLKAQQKALRKVIRNKIKYTEQLREGLMGSIARDQGSYVQSFF